MSRRTFLAYLQALLTIADSREQKAYAMTSLMALKDMVRYSDKVEPIVARMMMLAVEKFDYLWDERKQFIGTPGNYSENQKKRERLAMCITPGC